jgi:hypothetical protein
MKDRMELDDVVLIGRTFEEYRAIFQLQDGDLQTNRILDISAGISSFCAEATNSGYDVTAADPIYTLPVQAIAEKSEADLKIVLNQLPDVRHIYNWTFYRDPDHLMRFRTAARDRFLKDYARNPNRYIAAALPDTGFSDGSFDLVLVSHFLFLYDDMFDYEFHKRSLLELVRIARREIRIYPLANMRAAKSIFVERLMNDPDFSCRFKLERSNFEFIKNSNELLRVV